MSFSLINSQTRKSFAVVAFAFVLLAPAACEGPDAYPILSISESAINEDSGRTASFVAFGDWGSGRGPQFDVADAMEHYCAGEGCEFVVTLGDNFYDTGVESTDDPQWESKYRQIYGPLNLPFYVTAGNHDAYGNLQAQIDYSNVDPSWHMPSDRYSFVWPPDSPDPLVEFFVVGVDSFDRDDRKWLEESLDRSRALWKILTRHFPFITNRKVAESSDPLMEEAICNKVDLVLSGHNHFFSFLRGSKNGCWIEQVILGTGGAPLQQQSSNQDRGRLITTASVYGFGWFQASENKIIFRMITTDGSRVYSNTWRKPRGEQVTNP